MLARDLMTMREVFSASDTDDVMTAARMLTDRNVASLPVVDADGRLLGIVTDRDLCCRILGEGRSYETPVCDVMSSPVRTVQLDSSLEEIEATMRDSRVRHLPVLDEDNRLHGIISLSDLARHCDSAHHERQLVGVLEAVSPF